MKSKKAAAILGLVTVGGVLLLMTGPAKAKQSDDDDDEEIDIVGRTPDDFFDDDDDDEDELSLDNFPIRSPGIPQAPGVPVPGPPPQQTPAPAPAPKPTPQPPVTAPPLPVPDVREPVVIDVPDVPAELEPILDNLPVIIPRPQPAPTPPPVVVQPPPPQQPEAPPQVVLPPLAPATNAMVESLLNAEKRPGWKREESSVMAWQKTRKDATGKPLTPDGKFGPTSAKTLALESATIPIIRFWPASAGPRPDLALADYRAAINAIADQSDPARAALLRASARRETGQSFGPPQGNAGKLPVI